MEILILGAMIGLIPAAIANSKGYNFVLWWSFGAALFIVALPAALLMPRRAAAERDRLREGMKTCPFCAEFIKLEANVCKHCGRDLMRSQNVAEPGMDKAARNDGGPVADIATSGSASKSPERPAETGIDPEQFARLLGGERLPPKFDERGRLLEPVNAEHP